MTLSIDQTLHQFVNLLPNWTLLPILTILPNFGGFHRTLQRLLLANRGCLLLRTPGPVPFGTCICSNVKTILSWTCHVYRPFEFRTSLGTFISLDLITDFNITTRCDEVSIEHFFSFSLATSAASQQRTFTHPGTWPCPIWDLNLLKCGDHFLLNLLCLRTLNSEHPLVLLFYFASFHYCCFCVGSCGY